MVFDDEHIALWERGKGTTTENLTDGTPVTIFMRKPALREAGILPKGGILRLYGRAKIHKSGAVYEEIWNRLIEAEKKGDPEKRGYAVLVTIERAEDLSGQPLTAARCLRRNSTAARCRPKNWQRTRRSDSAGQSDETASVPARGECCRRPPEWRATRASPKPRRACATLVMVYQGRQHFTTSDRS